MIWYNIKTGFRYLARQKYISLMNLLGLSIGMCVAILIFYYVNFEMSYDNFHKNGKQIYRIISVNKGTGGTDFRATTPLPLPAAVRADIKDVEMTTGLSLFLNDDEPVQIGDQSFFNLTGYTADSCFLKMFNFPLIHGNTAHGDVRLDPYAWIRNKDNPEVMKYLQAENKHTESIMSRTQPLQDKLFEEMKGRMPIKITPEA